ncbi:hypothetical protein EVG20_g4010 [Dentipellis fragilis]|uniref:Uncharacterized protein n=1 Tax=Dentipellis fragilis TaxID=205917 RepID=A0A4Y9Z1J9_9AGAM|nr:hypothetical protein EVG20_g4010 [Dentipellis fragilis]
MDHIDTSWCPVCSRHILPKRYLVPVPTPTAPAPAPTVPPSSPSTSPAKLPSDAPAMRQTRRTGTVRAKGGGGLVRGTGRVQPNGALKRSDSTKDAPAPALPAAPVKHRTVIDQNPTPLYCSDECRLADLNNTYGGLSIDYNPDRDPRDSPPLPPVPHNSLTGVDAAFSFGSETDSSSEVSSSPDSQDKVLTDAAYDSPPMSASVAALARIYNWGPLPPRPVPAQIEEPSQPEVSDDYQSGVMMAGRRIKDALCPDTTVRRNSAGFSQPSRERKPIPGWTDGSDAWRSSVYSFSPPTHSGLKDAQERPSAYKSFAASPHRSTGVYSTLGEGSTPTPAAHGSSTSLSSSNLTQNARSNTSDELYLKYPLSFARRSDSRSSLSGSVPQPQSLPVPARRREHNILKPGAEGKLLVPDVKLRSSGGSASSSFDNASLSSWRSASTRSLAKSPLSRYGSEVSEDDVSMNEALEMRIGAAGSVPHTSRRPTVETRSWSYENVMTYPVMPMPKRKEKRFERKVIDGVPQVIETEVEVEPQMKRLFLFPGKETRRC